MFTHFFHYGAAQSSHSAAGRTGSPESDANRARDAVSRIHETAPAGTTISGGARSSSAPSSPANASRRRWVDRASEDEVNKLLAVVDQFCCTGNNTVLRRLALEQLSIALRPQQLRAEARRAFAVHAVERGVVAAAVRWIELGSADLVVAASNFLSDFAFGSDIAAQAVLQAFGRIANCFRRIFDTVAWEYLPLLEAAVLLCVNIAAMCPAGHATLIPLVRPVCVRIIRNPKAPDKLRGNTITLLANLSMTVGPELRSLCVVQDLLDLILENKVSGRGRSVAESVIIFLHGDTKSDEVDKLMSLNVVGEYCVPLMELTLRGDEFRGMYPYLMYSARVFYMLAQSREYAEALVSDERVVPLLLQANRHRVGPMQVESDLEGRRLALEAICSLTRLRLWPRESDVASLAILKADLPELLCDEHSGIRASAVALWARLNVRYVIERLLVGHRLETAGIFPATFWSSKVLSFLFPFLDGDASEA